MINIIPLEDTEEHLENEKCKCNPEILIENEEEIVVHHAFDNREIIEQININ